MCERVSVNYLNSYTGMYKFQAKRITKVVRLIYLIQQSVHCLQEIPQCTLNVMTAGKCQFTSTMLRDN